MSGPSSGLSIEARLQADRRKKSRAGKDVLAKIPTGPKAGVRKPKLQAKVPAANLNGQWTHDLYTKASPKTPTLASRMSQPATKINPKISAKLASNPLFAALHGGGGGKTGAPTAEDLGVIIRGSSKAKTAGITIKGSSGPFAVHASNFAQGTTASDIRAVMSPIGTIVNCGILTAQPTVIAEIVFEKREDAQTCIEQYNNKVADGKVLHLMLKDSPTLPIPAKTRQPPTGPAKSRPVPHRERLPGAASSQTANGNVVDGRFGFRPPPQLYSDAVVQRGRGFNR